MAELVHKNSVSDPLSSAPPARVCHIPLNPRDADEAASQGSSAFPHQPEVGYITSSALSGPNPSCSLTPLLTLPG